MHLTNAKIESGYTKLIENVDTENRDWTLVDAINPINKERLASNIAVQLLNKIDEPSKEKPFTNVNLLLFLIKPSSLGLKLPEFHLHLQCH